MELEAKRETAVSIELAGQAPPRTAAAALSAHRASETIRAARAAARAGIVPASLVTAFLLAAAGYIIACVGAARTAADFDAVGRTVQLSSAIVHMISLYDGCRIALLVTGLAALLAFPAALLAASVTKSVTAGRGLQSLEASGNSKQGMAASRAAHICATVLCTLALVVAVLSIAVSVKASDTVASVKNRVDSGAQMFSSASLMLTQFRATTTNGSPNPIDGLISGLLSSLTGNAGGQGDALGQLFNASDLTGFFRLLSPIQVGNLVRAIDPSPQSLLQLVAFVSNRLPQAQSAGLVCPVGCLNQVDACICNVGELAALSRLQTEAAGHSHLALVGSCVLAFGLGLLCTTSQLSAAKYKFLRRLVFSDAFDRHIAAKHALLARSNSCQVRSGSLHLRRASGSGAKEPGAHVVPIQVSTPINQG